MKPLSVNDRRAKDIDDIVSIGHERLSKAAALLEKTRITSDISIIIDAFRDIIGANRGELLARHMISLCMLMERRESDPESVLAALRAGLMEFGWDESQIGNFDSASPYLKKIVGSETLYVSVKSYQLFAEDSNHIHEFKIYTDARPVFNRDRTETRATLVFSTLSLVASSADEEEVRLTVSLSARDLEDLRKECEKALKKLETYEAALRRGQPGEVLVYGNPLE